MNIQDELKLADSLIEIEKKLKLSQPSEEKECICNYGLEWKYFHRKDCPMFAPHTEKECMVSNCIFNLPHNHRELNAQTPIDCTLHQCTNCNKVWLEKGDAVNIEGWEEELKLYLTSAGDRRRTIHFIKELIQAARREVVEEIRTKVSNMRLDNNDTMAGKASNQIVDVILNKLK